MASVVWSHKTDITLYIFLFDIIGSYFVECQITGTVLHVVLALQDPYLL